ncbi:hypothetical protein D3C87_1864720 [compost metagenome]
MAWSVPDYCVCLPATGGCGAVLANALPDGRIRRDWYLHQGPERCAVRRYRHLVVPVSWYLSGIQDSRAVSLDLHAQSVRPHPARLSRHLN